MPHASGHRWSFARTTRCASSRRRSDNSRERWGEMQRDEARTVRTSGIVVVVVVTAQHNAATV
jgi:hypothetical protein